MDKLYPIIRRKRRPLILADVPPVAAGPVQPVVVADGQRVESVPAAPAPEQPKTSDVKNLTNIESE
jgi:hypothetical protein